MVVQGGDGGPVTEFEREREVQGGNQIYPSIYREEIEPQNLDKCHQLGGDTCCGLGSLAKTR